MPIPRIFHPISLNPTASVTLDEAASRHLLTVLRLRIGEPLAVFNGQGGEYRAVLRAVQKKLAVIEVGERQARDCESPLRIHLGQGISRGERMDYAVQKSVELGVHAITPLTTARCGIQRDAKRAGKRSSHWQKVAISASEQSGRCYVPPVFEPQPLAMFLSQASGLRLICVPGQKSHLEEKPKEGCVTVVIGPEGGFTEEEIAQAETMGFQRFSLGPRILRTETAPVAAIACLQSLWGDILQL